MDLDSRARDIRRRDGAALLPVVLWEHGLPEAVQKVDEMSNKFNEKSVEYQATITEMQAAIAKSEKVAQLTTATLNELIDKMYPDEETADGATDEATKEN